MNDMESLLVRVPVCRCRVDKEQIRFCNLHAAAEDLFVACHFGLIVVERWIHAVVDKQPGEGAPSAREKAEKSLRLLLKALRNAALGQAPNMQ